MAESEAGRIARLESEIMALKSVMTQMRASMGLQGVEIEEEDGAQTRTDGGVGTFDETCVPPSDGEGQSGAFRYEASEDEIGAPTGRITHCHFLWDGAKYTLADVENAGDGTWYLKVDKEHPGSSTVTNSAGSPGTTSVLVPLFTVEDGEIVDDYRGMPCLASEHPELEAGDGIEIEEEEEGGRKKYVISGEDVECDEASTDRNKKEKLQVYGFENAEEEESTIAACMGMSNPTDYLVLAKDPSTGKMCYLKIGKIEGDNQDETATGGLKASVDDDGVLKIENLGIKSLNGKTGEVDLETKSDSRMEFDTETDGVIKIGAYYK